MSKKNALIRAQPLIAVKDVEKSSRWYRELLVCKSAHGNGEDGYDRLMSGDELILQLHSWDAEDDAHVHMGSPKVKPNGNGVLLWFETKDFDGAVKRARKLKAKVLEEPHVNPNAGHREIWLKDPDGYVVVLAG